MIDLIVDRIQSGINYEMGTGSPYYSDYLLEFVTNRNITFADPNKSVAVLEGESEPVEFEISNRISQTKEKFTVKIYLLIRGASGEETKGTRRALTQRIRHAFLRRNGNIFTNLLTTIDSGVGYEERVSKYKIARTQYDNTDIGGDFIYLAALDIDVETEVNYTE